MGPEELFELEILVSHVEDGLSLLTIHLVEDSIGDHLFQDALVTILQEEVLVALGARDDIVDENTNLVAQALVILFVTPSEDHLEWSL